MKAAWLCPFLGCDKLITLNNWQHYISNYPWTKYFTTNYLRMVQRGSIWWHKPNDKNISDNIKQLPLHCTSKKLMQFNTYFKPQYVNLYQIWIMFVWSDLVNCDWFVLIKISSTKLFSIQIFLAAAFRFIIIAALIYKKNFNWEKQKSKSNWKHKFLQNCPSISQIWLAFMKIKFWRSCLQQTKFQHLIDR